MPLPGHSRRPLIVTLLAGLAVLVVGAIIMTVVFTTGGRHGVRAGNAGDTVKAYLEALARGDADGALAFGAAEPGSRKFLTDEVLKQQISEWPIENINVIESQEYDGGAVVKVQADFGDQHSVGDIPLVKSGRSLKLKSAFLHMTTLASIKPNGPSTSLTILGKPLGEDNDVYVFPGYLGVKSTPWVNVDMAPMLLDALTVGDIGRVLDISYAINDAGHKAINDAIGEWLLGCWVQPEKFYNCGERSTDTPIKKETVKINVPVDLSKVTQQLMPTTLSVMVMGPVAYSFTAELVSGGTSTFTGTTMLSGGINLAKDPLVFGPLR